MDWDYQSQAWDSKLDLSSHAAYVTSAKANTLVSKTDLFDRRYLQILGFDRGFLVILDFLAALLSCRKKDSTELRNRFQNWLSQNNVNLVTDQQPNDELHLVSLEERVLYSAVPLPLEIAEPVDTVMENVEAFDFAANVEQGLELIQDGLGQFFDEGESDDILNLANSEMHSNEIGDEKNELVLVDQSVDGFQKLVDDILGGKSDQNTHYEIAFINSSSNGIHQISGILENQTNENKTYNAVHLGNTRF